MLLLHICPLLLILYFFFFSFLLEKAEGQVGWNESGESHSSLLWRKSVHLPVKKGKHVFILGKQTSHFPRKMTATVPVECFCANALIFYYLHAVYNTFARILGGKARLFSPVYNAAWMTGNVSLRTFLYCTYLYILTISPCMNTFFVIFACFPFLPNWPTMGILLYRKKYACNFFPGHSLPIASKRIRSEFTKKL